MSKYVAVIGANLCCSGGEGIDLLEFTQNSDYAIDKTGVVAQIIEVVLYLRMAQENGT